MRTPSFWHSPNLLAYLLTPLALPYGIGAWLDRTFTRTQHAPIPVISVGNLTAGGAGKTPTTIALIAALRMIGETPHIVTRGYGGRMRKPTRVTQESDWREVGDEALLLANHAPTWVSRNRLAAARLAAHEGASCVVLDDGLQHHRIYKDISLLVIDGAYGLGNGLPLPAGPLRESVASARTRCDAVVMLGADQQGLTPHLSLPCFTAEQSTRGSLLELRAQPVVAFAGLARPEKFFASLEPLGATLVDTRSFPDHHPYSIHDLKELSLWAKSHEARLVATAKDAVKIPPMYRDPILVLDTAVYFADNAALHQFLSAQLAIARA